LCDSLNSLAGSLGSQGDGLNYFTNGLFNLYHLTANTMVGFTYAEYPCTFTRSSPAYLKCLFIQKTCTCLVTCVCLLSETCIWGNEVSSLTASNSLSNRNVEMLVERES